MENEKENVAYVGAPVGIITKNILCFGDLADNYFSEIIATILNILRSGNACEIIIEAKTKEETIAVALGLRIELEEATNTLPTIIEDVFYKEKGYYQSRNPDGSESYKKIMVALYSVDPIFTIEQKPNIISRFFSRIKEVMMPINIIDGPKNSSP